MYAREKKIKFLEYIRDLIDDQVDVDNKEPYKSFKEDILRQLNIKITRLGLAVNTYNERHRKVPNEKAEAQNPGS